MDKTTVDERFLRHLLDINRQMAETRDLDSLLNYAMHKALELLQAERGFLVLLSDGGQLDFRVRRDNQGRELPDAEQQVSYSIIGQVLESQRSIVLTDAMQDPQFGQSSSVNALQLRSVMCVPLVARGQIIGALYVENRSDAAIFEDDDLEPLEFFATQAAIAIENAQLSEHLEEMVAMRTAELHDALNQLEGAWMEAVEANRIRTQMLSNIAHDIRSPISLAVSALGMLEEQVVGPINAKQMEWLQRAMTNLHHAVKLTSDVFDLTKLEMDKLVIHRERVATHAYLQNLHAIGLGMPWPEEVELRLDIQSPLPDLYIDPTRIQQVVLNLLSNAHKYTAHGIVTLYARYLDVENAVLIGVADTGTGIPPERVMTIFERFQQAADDDVKRQRLGTGLGLAISRELVEQHGGQIWVTSELHHGSDFKFVLPVDRPPQA